MNRPVIGITLLLILALVACNNTDQPTAKMDSPVQASAAKRYRLKGKVVSIDKQAKMANIDSEAIPGFMGAMTMPYPVKPEAELDKLSPGDSITADVVVADDNGWLENIVVTGHGAASSKSK